MKLSKKILSIVLKTSIGIGCLLIVYFKLLTEFTPENLFLLQNSILSLKGISCFALCLILIPINWGLEALKWQIITKPVENINFKIAKASVYSGVCLGNFAPGRATEFLGKILYFSDEHKTKITVLHFINGMIQLSVTLMIGLAALILKLQDFSVEYIWMTKAVLVMSCLLLLGFVWACFNINKILNAVSRFISKKKNLEPFYYPFPISLLFRLFIYSVLRYLVFSSQFFLLLFLFHQDIHLLLCLPGIALYFLITSTLPMISFIEAAIRAAIALVVFKGCGINAPVLALSSVLLWLINIIVPSIVGYFALLKMKFDFKLIKTKK